MPQISSIVVVPGQLAVFELDPERNGWIAATIQTCPSGEMAGRFGPIAEAQAKTGRWAGSNPGAPSMVSLAIT